MPKVKTSEIAAAAGVSKTTVSFVLNHRNGSSISAETQKKVIDVAKKLGYVPPKKTEKQRTLTLGLMVPTLSNLYYPFLLQNIEIEAKSRGLNTIIMNVLRNKNNEEYYLNYLTNGTVDGILALYTPNMYIASDLPVVIVGEDKPDIESDTISVNSHEAGYMMADHLLSLGHKEFAYISTPLDNITSARQHRLDGIIQRLKENDLENNITVLTGLSEYEENDTAYEYNCGYDLTNELLKKTKKVTAIIAVNDTTASGCMVALKEKGIRIPQDIALAGFDNLLIGKMMDPQLTTIDQMVSHACQVALDMLKAKICNPMEQTLPIKLEYKPHLVIRDSTLFK